MAKKCDPAIKLQKEKVVSKELKPFSKKQQKKTPQKYITATKW